ncbi:hypothetical protein DE167_004088 [Clostridium beijerinckii]|nr:transposase domain-containing protein [Clostridium beijerinckii]NYC73622.1 hypothetical protein [Clostridium beijerinckii]
MFSKTSKGASSSALLYSIIETAKANGLVTEKYLVYLFEVLASSEIKERDILEKYAMVGKHSRSTACQDCQIIIYI